jgi:hypothetical protein
LVALPTFWVLFIQKFARRSQGTKTFDLNQNFEPRARNRRPTIDVGGCEDARSSMSDEFDLGMTALTMNNIVVVPIRTGVGIRLGANFGYLKFTPTATWNPF